MSLAAVRVRGSVGVRGDILDTLRMLRLTRVNHCTVLPAEPETEGMLRKAADYLTWGEIEPPVLTDLLAARGRVTGDRPLTEDYVKDVLGYPSVKALAEALSQGEVRLRDLEGVRPVFRLHPPVKGYEGVKRAFTEGGALGHRGEAINALLRRMME